MQFRLYRILIYNCRLLDKKPILRTANPRRPFKTDKVNLLEKRQQMLENRQDTDLCTKNERGEITSINRDTLDALLKEITWSTTTQKANKESAIPIPQVN